MELELVDFDAAFSIPVSTSRSVVVVRQPHFLFGAVLVLVDLVFPGHLVFPLAHLREIHVDRDHGILYS